MHRKSIKAFRLLTVDSLISSFAGMVDSFNVSLSASFIRKKAEGDEARTAAERNVETVYHSCCTNYVIV